MSVITAWAATTAYAINDVVSLSTGDYWLICTTNGTSAGSEPTAPTATGETVNDGTVVWSSITQNISPRTDNEANLGGSSNRWKDVYIAGNLSNGTNTGTVAQIAASVTHAANTANPHATDIGNLGSGTLAELNAIITDATLDTSSAARTPTTHATSHESAGSDVISHQNLSGAGSNTHTQIDTHIAATGIAVHGLGTSSTYNVAASGDAAVGEVVKGDDTRLTDTRTPTTHASSHTNGVDDIQNATSLQKGLMTATYAGNLDELTDGTNTNLHLHDHVNLLNKGTNTHAQIDTKIQNAIKFQGVDITDTVPTQDRQALLFDTTASAYTLGTVIEVPGSSVSGAICTFIGTAGTAIQSSLINTNADGRIILPEGIEFATVISAPTHTEGLLFYDQTNKCLAYYNDEADVTLQIGQEMWVRVYNNTGSAITNGKVCYLSGVNGTVPTVALAQSHEPSTCLATLGFATHDIENASYGYITRLGTVRDVNTSGFSSGTVLYLSDSTPGAVTDTEPDSPSYSITLGVVTVSNATTGTIEVEIDVGNNLQDTIKVYDGSILEDHTVTVSSNGTTISLSLEKTGGGDLHLFFDGGYVDLDTTPAASVNLTAGTDTVPVLNYVYIPKDTVTLTANTTGFDWTQQIVPIATVLCQSAASAQVDGVLKNHAWTDHLANSVGQGHLSDISKWIRNQNATWLTGTALSVNAGAATFDVSTTSGTMLQLHEHDVAAMNTATGTNVYIVNDSSVPYRKLGDLTTVVTDSLGVSMSNKYYNLVFWISKSQGTGNNKLFCNLPTGSYVTSADAIEDLSGYTDYSIPTSFKGTAYLVARVTMRNQSGSGGTFTTQQIEDLRGTYPSNAGGGVGGGGAENFVDLLDVPSSYTGAGGKIVQVNSGETAVEFSKDITVDTINEYTAGHGITADGVLLKDSSVSAVNLVASGYVQTNVINEYTAGHGVTIDGVQMKDSNITAVDLTATTLTASGDIEANNFSGKNAIIGGDFATNPWQRGTTFTAVSDGQYTADGFLIYDSHDGVVDVLKTADAPTAAESGFYTTHCYHVDVTTADASIGAAQYCGPEQRIEGYRAKRFGFGQAGTRYVTLSFWHKHTVTGTNCVVLRNAASNRHYIAEYTQDVSDTWEKEEITIPVDTTGTWTYDNTAGLRVLFTVVGGSNYQSTPEVWGTGNKFSTASQVNNLSSTDNNFKIALVQLEAGQKATRFEDDSKTVLANCLERFERKRGLSVYSQFGHGLASNTTTAYITVQHARKRTSAWTISSYGTFSLTNNISTLIDITSSLTLNQRADGNTKVAVTVAAGLTAGLPYDMVSKNDATYYIDINDDL